jgi:hypothetical protein
MESDFILAIDIHTETIPGIGMEGAKAGEPVLTRPLQLDSEQGLGEMDHLDKVGFGFEVCVFWHRWSCRSVV